MSENEVVGRESTGGRQGAGRKVVIGAVLASTVPPLTAALGAPIIAQAIGPVGRGQLAAVLGPLLIADGLGSVGLPIALTVFRSKGGSSRDLIRASLPLFIVGCMLALLALAAMIPIVSRQQSIPAWLLAAAWSFAPLSLAINSLRAVKVADDAWRQVNAEKIISGVARLLIVFGLWVAGVATVLLVVATYVITPILAATVLLKVSAPSMKWRNKSFGRKAFRRFAVHSYPGALIPLAGARLDVVLLAVIASPALVGNYSIAITVSELPGVIYLVIAQMMTARAARGVEADDLAKLARTAFASTLAMAALGSLAIQVLAVPLFGSGFETLRSVVPLLSLGIVAMAASTTSCAILSGSGRLHSVTTANCISLVGSSGLLLVLTPPFGIIGAAIGMALGRSFGAAVALAMVSRHSGASIADHVIPRFSDLRSLR